MKTISMVRKKSKNRFLRSFRKKQNQMFFSKGYYRSFQEEGNQKHGFFLENRFLLPFCFLCLAGIAVFCLWWAKVMATPPEERLLAYVEALEAGEYETMYGLLSASSQEQISLEEFQTRNQNIYEGIGLSDCTLTVTNVQKMDLTEAMVSYAMVYETEAGPISFSNEAYLKRQWGKGYSLVWQDSLIFPSLTATDKVQVLTQKANRGRILDRNGVVLAGQGEATSVGLVPGKMAEEKDKDMEKLAQLLQISVEEIETKLSASWVKEDSFVPIKTIEKVDEKALLGFLPDEKALENQQLQEALLSVEGVKLTDVTVREYPLREKASHLTGYVQTVTAEDLAEHEGEGYTADSVIGRSGVEVLYESELKGEDGLIIQVVTEDGAKKEVLAERPKVDGKDIRLTVDAALQASLYELFSESESASVALNPETGEVLALVSTPAYNSNDFVLGYSQSRWEEVSEDERKPLFNRFRQTFCPGSTIKPLVAAVGLMADSFDPEEDFGNVGRYWTKDESWGNYFITTTKAYDNVNLNNAMKYSDNIYFAKIALGMGEETFCEGLKGLGFGETLPFPIVMTASQISNSGTIEGEIQLADSGYGQGQLLVNPLHMALMYSAFYSGGDMVKPKLLYEGTPVREVWKEDVFTQDVANRVLEAMKGVIADPTATGAKGYIEGIPLAGKTGTAEKKAAKDDTSGTETGWFAVMTTEAEDPLLIVTMVEDVKPFGGCSYVVEGVRQAIWNYDAWKE